jgi:hypothetical protein
LLFHDHVAVVLEETLSQGDGFVPLAFEIFVVRLLTDVTGSASGCEECTFKAAVTACGHLGLPLFELEAPLSSALKAL